MEKLADHVDLLTGFPFKSESYTEEEDAIRLVRGDNIVQGALRWDNVKRWPSGEINGLAQYELTFGDVVLAMDRPWIAAGLKYARISEGDTPSLLVQRTSRLRAKPKLDQRFLYYIIGSQAFTDHVLAVQTGTAVPHISGKQIGEFQFRLPSLEEQRAIASVLGSLDDKIEQNRRTAGVLERLARAVFRAWFVDFEPVHAKAAPGSGATAFPSMPQPLFDQLPTTFQDAPGTNLGPIPQGWEVKPAGDIIDIHDSKRIPLSRKQRDERPGEFRYYGAAGVVDHVDDYLFDGTYLLLGEDGTVYGDGDHPMVQYVWGQFWVNNHAHVITGKAGFTVEHLVVLFQQVCIRPFITGAVQPKLNQKNLKSVPVIVAPPTVVEAFGELLGPLFSKQRQLADESRKLAELRDYLLPKLLSGAVRVKYAEEVAP